MNPEEWLYTGEHLWAEIGGQEARFGITDQVLKLNMALQDADGVLIAGFP